MCIVAQTKSRSDAQLNHSPNSLSSQQRRQQATIYLIFDKLAFFYPSGERFRRSGAQTIYCMGVLMLFQGPRLGKVVSFT